MVLWEVRELIVGYMSSPGLILPLCTSKHLLGIPFSSSKRVCRSVQPYSAPYYVYKSFLQAYSPALPVGAQHHYKSSFDALSTIFRAEGFRGLVRGIDAAILRTSMGSSVGTSICSRSMKYLLIEGQVQLPSYNFTKNQLVKRGILPDNSPLTFLASSAVSGACVVSTEHSNLWHI